MIKVHGKALCLVGNFDVFKLDLAPIHRTQQLAARAAERVLRRAGRRQATRQVCYRYETLSHDCEQSSASRTNPFDGSHYFHQEFLLKSCDGDTRKVRGRARRLRVYMHAKAIMLTRIYLYDHALQGIL